MDVSDPRPTPSQPEPSPPAITVSTDIQEGVGCVFQAVAFAIVLWALYTFSGPFWALLFNH